jgi:hypothetical protein
MVELSNADRRVQRMTALEPALSAWERRVWREAACATSTARARLSIRLREFDLNKLGTNKVYKSIAIIPILHYTLLEIGCWRWQDGPVS